MSVENDPIFREVYEQGNARAAKASLLRLIDLGLGRHEVFLDETQGQELVGWNLEDLEALADELMVGMHEERLREWLPKPKVRNDDADDGPKL
jgi:hypothetical protein